MAAGATVLALVGACVVAAWAGGAPLVPAAAGRAGERDGWTLVFLAALAGAFLAYLLALRLLPRSRLRVAAALGVAAAIQLLPLGAPLLLSTDAWTYWEYGAIANDGGNPYRDTPAEHPANPAYEHAGADWRDTTSVYGPAFSLFSQLVAHLAGSSEDAAAWIFKVVAALAVLALAALAGRLASDRPFAVAFVGWNPLLAIHFAGGGHNDAVMMALVLGAIALATAGRRRAAAALWPLAILVKWIPLVFFALRVLDARSSGRRVAHGVFAATTAAILALATWQYGTGWVRASGPLADNAGEQTSYAFPHRLEQLGLPHALALGLAGVALVVGLGLLAREARRGRPHLGRAGCLLIVVTPWLTPWYVIWAVPLAAAEEDWKAQLAALALCAYVLPQTVL